MSIPPELIAFVAGFPILLAHLGIAVTAFILWAAVYTLLSRGQEIAQIQNGNPASSVIYGATLFALAIPLGRALSASTGLLDIAIWTGAARATDAVRVGGSDPCRPYGANSRRAGYVGGDFAWRRPRLGRVAVLLRLYRLS